MVIDCHYHLEERILGIPELLQEMDRSGVDKTVLMGSITGPMPELPAFLISVLQYLLETAAFRGIGRLLVANFTQKGDIKVLGKPYPIMTDPDNESVFGTIEKYPDRFLGWIFVNPRGKKNQVAEFERFKDRPGFIGVKAHPFWHHFNPVELLPVAEKLSLMGKPLLIHAGFDDEGDFDALLEKVPDLKLVLAHAGFPTYRDTWKKIKNRRNIFLDVSQAIYTSERASREAVNALGEDRIFFGTDGPYGLRKSNGIYDYGFIKRRIERIFPDAGVRKRILGESFADVAGLSH